MIMNLKRGYILLNYIYQWGFFLKKKKGLLGEVFIFLPNELKLKILENC